MPEDLQSRFTVYDRPHALPGKCCVCGASDRPVVDFGRDVEWDNGYGRAYFCEDCIKQAASKFPQPELFQNDLITREQHEQELAEQKANLHAGLLDYLNRFTSLGLGTELVPVYGTPDNAPEQTKSDDATDPEPDEPESSKSSGETDSPFSFEGASGISSNSGNEPVGLLFGNL